MGLYQNKYRIESIRLTNWDYSNPGKYFVTICTKNRKCLFGKINDGKMLFNDIGSIANKFWAEIPVHFPNVELDEFVIMPNHVHGIVVILHSRRDVACNVSTPIAPNTQINNFMSSISPKKQSLSTIIRSFKSAVTNWCTLNNYKDFKWQERFYDEIIRNEISLIRIREYIRKNPLNWNNDDFRM